MNSRWSHRGARWARRYANLCASRRSLRLCSEQRERGLRAVQARQLERGGATGAVRIGGRVDRQGDAELGADADLALHADRAVVGLDDLLYDGQAQAAVAAGVAARLI